MRTVKDECCGCAVPAYPCLGSSCPNRNVVRYYCDRCKEEFEPSELYVVDGEEICTDCLLADFETVEERGE